LHQSSRFHVVNLDLSACIAFKHLTTGLALYSCPQELIS
jgi:hypothetical protein